MRKLIVAVAAGAALVAVPAAPAVAAPTGTKPPTIKAEAGLLSLNGRTIWKSEANARRPIASLVKVMTAIVVLRTETDLDRPIKIKRKYTTYGDKWGATEARLIVGDRVKVRDLIYGTLLESGADAAAALADTYGPGYDGFVKKMNAEVERLGLRDTKYANFDGLPYPTQYSTYSTAASQVKLGRYALRFPTLKKVIATKKITVRSLDGRSYSWKNTNTLIGKYKGGLGIKTGYTSKAGYCLLFAAQRGKETQVGVILGAPTPSRRFTDATRLLNWGFGI